MRVLLDANVYLSALITNTPDSPLVRIMEGFFLDEFTLLFPEDVLEEFIVKAIKKPFLNHNIMISEIEVLVSQLYEQAEIISQITDPIPQVTRDPKDDYLISYALIGAADYLVSGDKDLLTLKRVETVKIIAPTQFVGLLGK